MAQSPDIGNLAGTWTYRSFLNDPDLSADFNILEFGRGNIAVAAAPMGVFKGRIFGPGWSLDLNGAIGYGNPWSVRFQGKGIVVGEEWIYDYTGVVVPPWPKGWLSSRKTERFEIANRSKPFGKAPPPAIHWNLSRTATGIFAEASFDSFQLLQPAGSQEVNRGRLSGRRRRPQGNHRGAPSQD